MHASIDPTILMSIGLDQTQTIRASVADIERTLLISVALVVLVVFLFLREYRATLIPLVAVPASIIGTLAAMYVFGYSIDNLSLMALTISTGFVVDDAIVVLENITRYQEMGMDAEAAARRGAAEIGSTVLSMSVSLVAVFIPILLMGGIIGRLFREFAVVLSVAILVSLAVSLSTTPMMCSVLLRKKAAHGKWYLASERAFERILKGYEKSLSWVLDHSLLLLIVFIATVAFNVYLYIEIPKGFFPQQDTGRLIGSIIADQSISFQAMQKKIAQLAAIAKQDRAVDTVLIFTGGGGGTTTNTGRVFIALKPLAQRKSTADQIINRLRPKLAVVPGATLFLQAVQDVRMGGRQSAAQYQYTIHSDNLQTLNHWGAVLLKSFKGIRRLTDMNSDAQNKGLQANLAIDRQTAARLGITPQDIDNVLYDAFGEREIATTYTPLNQYYVVMVVDPSFWQDPAALQNIYVAASGGGMVPLSAFTHYEAGTAPLAVNHSSVFPSVTFSFNLAPGVALGEAVNLINDGGEESGHADEHHRLVQRHGSGVHRLAVDRAAADRRGHRRGLCRARHSVRELHPSGHDSLHAAFGRCRRAARTARHAHRAQRHRPDRNHSAHRHRQKERDHDDRLRHRGRTARTYKPQGGRVSGMPAALPADHDDHHGGAARRRSPGRRHGHGIGAEAPVGYCDRRRIDHESGADLVHDAGDLSLHGPAEFMGLQVRIRIAAGRRRRSRRACSAMRRMSASFLRGSAAAALLLCGCNLAPHYDAPRVQPSAQFKEAGSGGDSASQGWKPAEPRDAAIRSKWWEAYDDPQLNDLEERVAISNQNIIAAEASYRAAHALMLEAQAQLFPTLSLAPSVTRENSSVGAAGFGGSGISKAGSGTTSGAAQGAVTSPHTIYTLPLEASYQIDLWGGIRNTVAVNRYAAQASAAQLANALLSTQSTLAEDYFQLRVADEQRRILETTVADYQASLRLVRTLVASGVDSEADVATAEAQLESAMASATDVGVARAQYEHAIAVLIGVPPAQLSIPYEHFKQTLPAIPVGVPSDLLERRPDIAAAERVVAQSNAQIGVARAAFFPSLTLGASGGYESTALSQLFDAPNRFWSVGPSLTQILFDAGARSAAVAQARALNESQVAAYRQTVLSAFQSVEDQLAALRILSVELGQAHKATMAARRAVELTVVLFRNGVDSYVSVITAQNSFLSARETELQVELRQLIASVSLINDLGGGWSTSEMPQTERTAMHPPEPRGEARIPPENSRPAVPNPPAMPPGEVQPDDFIRQIEDEMAPAPAGGGPVKP